MGIYVKGMEMPEKCGLCDLFHAESPMYCTRVKGHKTVGAPYGMPRPEWCPLVEVPEPHGRLIDETIVLEMIRKSMGIKDLSFLYNAEKSVVNEIFHAPTVIEAEDK